MQNAMNYDVELWSFGSGGVNRIVSVPAAEANASDSQQLLSLIFRYGQNDFQNQTMRSVSAGDVIVINESSKWLVCAVGFKALDRDAYIGYVHATEDARSKMIWKV